MHGRKTSYLSLSSNAATTRRPTLSPAGDDTPADLVPGPDAKGADRCVAGDRARLLAIANRYKASMMANGIEASKLQEFTRIP